MNVMWRTLLVMLTARRRLRRRGRLAPTGISRIRLTTLLTDIDLLLHMNNGRYLSLFDLGRWDLLVRTGLWDVMKARGWYAVVSSETVTFRKSLNLWQRFTIESRLVGYDEKAVYLEQRFVRPGANGEPEIYAQGFIRARFLRKSGGTVPVPELIEAFGTPPVDDELPEWIERWGADVALPATRAEAPSVWA